MKIKNKGTLISIIVLLVVFIPCTIVGMIDRFKEVNKEHKSFYDGSLYFYDKKDELVGTYKCVNTICSIADVEFIDTGEKQKTSLINNRYVFINDEKTIKLVDITNNNVIANYDNIFVYNDIVKKNYFIVLKDGLYGVISTVPTIVTFVELKYSSLELFQSVEGIYSLNYILAKDDKNYVLENGKEKYSSNDEILYACNNYLVLKDLFNNINIINYDGNNLFSASNVLDFEIINNYIIFNSNNSYFVYLVDFNSDDHFKLYKTYDNNITYKKENNSIIISLNDEVIETISLGLEN